MLRAVAVLLVACGLALPAALHAQRALQIPVQFDFVSPGARSLALGGAFTAVADDATAAFTNPAGLRMLTRREVSIEARTAQTETVFLQGGRLQGSVTNQGIDTVVGPLFGRDSDTSLGVSFVSFVSPVKNGTIAAYRHELARFASDVATSGPFIEGGREQPLRQQKSIDVVNYGVSAAYALSDAVVVGGGWVVSDFQLSGATAFYSPHPEQFFGAPTYSANLQTFIGTQRGDDFGVGFSAGTLITPHPRLKVGAVFRRSARAQFTQFDRALPDGEVFFDNVEGDFKIPDVTSLGVSLRPRDEVLVSLEYNRVNYSSLRDDFVRLQAGPQDRPGRENFFDRFSVPDVNEWHAGVEVVLPNAPGQPALRAGLWYDPDHSIQYAAVNDGTADDILFVNAFSSGRDTWHYSAGLGLAISARFELNIGADLSARRSTASLSSILRF